MQSTVPVDTHARSAMAATLQPARSNIHPTYRPDIDGLRALAVLSVVIFHTFPNALPGGFVGVDIFFVISGFLISSILLQTLDRGDFNFSDFYAHRIRRIFPALLLVLAASYLVGWFTLLPGESKQLGKHIAAGAGFIQNFILWQEAGYFDTGIEWKPLMHLWSLSVEEQFYLVYPVCIWGAWRLGLNLLLVVVSLALVSFGLNIVVVTLDTTHAYFSPHTRFWELLAGAILAYLTVPCQTARRQRPTRGFISAISSNIPQPSRHSHAWASFGLLLVLASMAAIHKDLAFPGWWALAPVSGAFLIMASGPQAWVNQKILSNRYLVFVGLISYPLYLWHWPILAFARIVESSALRTETRIWAVALSLLLAWLTYRLIERPIQSRRKTRTTLFVLSVGMAFMGLAGYVTYRNDGLAVNELPSNIAGASAETGQDNFSFSPYSIQRQCQRDGHQTLCTEDKPFTLFIWGDSHAAALYPGLNTLQRRHASIGVSHSTGCGNPPFVVQGEYTDAWCNSPAQRLAQNMLTLHTIATTRPQIVLLHARWAYEHYHTDQRKTVEKIRATIQSIHAASPTSTVVVLGPVPNWKSTLAHEMFVYWRKTFPHTTAPQYMRSGLVEEIAGWDDYLAREVPGLAATYLSAYKTLCKPEGCLTSVGPNPSDLTAIDYGHLSPTGSIYLVEHLAPALLSLLGPAFQEQDGR